MYSLFFKNIKRRLRIDGFYLCILLCMGILVIKFFIDKNQNKKYAYEISEFK